MWLITNRGFYSGVQDKLDPDTIVIRARTDRHLKAIMGLLPKGTQIVTHEGTDYPCRVRVTKAQWVELCTALADEVDYTNFKDSVERGKKGKALKNAKYDHGVYMSVWSILHRLTSAREYDAHRRSSGSDAQRPSRRGRRHRSAGERTMPMDLEAQLDALHSELLSSSDVSMSFDPFVGYDEPSWVRGGDENPIEGGGIA